MQSYHSMTHADLQALPPHQRNHILKRYTQGRTDTPAQHLAYIKQCAKHYHSKDQRGAL